MVFLRIVHALQVWNVVLGKDYDLGTRGSFYCEWTLLVKRNSRLWDTLSWWKIIKFNMVWIFFWSFQLHNQSYSRNQKNKIQLYFVKWVEWWILNFQKNVEELHKYNRLEDLIMTRQTTKDRTKQCTLKICDKKKTYRHIVCKKKITIFMKRKIK